MLHFDDGDRAAIRALLQEPIPTRERPIDRLIATCADDIRAALTRGWSASRIATTLRNHLTQKGETAPSVETIRDRIRTKFALRKTLRKARTPRKISAAAAAAASPPKNKATTLRPNPPADSRDFGKNDPMNLEALAGV